MSKKSINFDDKYINKSKFYKNKKLFNPNLGGVFRGLF